MKGAMMGWGRTFLLGDVGNRMDISDCEQDIRVLKESLMEIHQEEQEQDTELMILKRENDELKLYIASIIRLLTNKGMLTAEEIEKMVDIIDAEDGAMDGKVRGDVM
jgi:chromosome segregation ATPase